jgi:hypothetical protein
VKNHCSTCIEKATLASDQFNFNFIITQKGKIAMDKVNNHYSTFGMFPEDQTEKRQALIEKYARVDAQAIIHEIEIKRECQKLGKEVK